jgi:hypothetical protein
VRDLVGFLGQRFLVVVARGVGVEREVELVLPAEVEAGVREGVVAQLRRRVALGEVGGVGGDLETIEASDRVIIAGRSSPRHRRIRLLCYR